LVFARHDGIGVEAAIGVVGFVRYQAGNPGTKIRADLL
jgi:hypothetical protein